MKQHAVNRRDFLAAASGTAIGASLAGLPAFGQVVGREKIAWKRDPAGRLFVRCEIGGRPIAPNADAPLLNAFCTLGKDEAGERLALDDNNPAGQIGPIKAELNHRLLDSESENGQDLLEATLRLTNISDQRREVCSNFVSHAGPLGNPAERRAYLPLAASGMLAHPALKSLGFNQEKDPDQAIGTAGLLAHYLEPLASDPAVRQSRVMLLVPVVDAYCPESPWRIAMFTPSGIARRFAISNLSSGANGWSARRFQTIEPGQSVEERCYLLVHRGESDIAWRAFHRFAHEEPHPRIEWLDGVRVHYYDFLSAADAGGRRGDGFDADLPYFRRFRVRLATQHGYYPWWGEYIDPKLKQWQAMRADKHGPAEMSLEKMKGRIAAARREGAKAGVYMHLAGLNATAPAFDRLRDAVVVDESGKPYPIYWQGPDTPGRSWQMSMAAAEWREHLLRQARLIMEILNPDAIVMDETFSGLGYDEHPDRRGPLSTHTIAFFRELRKLMRSFGEDRAILTSDCSLAGFVPWADGEAGDHAYASLLGNPLYCKMPVRYTAALGGRRWVPCAWNFRRFWDAQLDLARKTGAGVGVSNGWEEYTGLARLPAEAAARIEADIASL
ncbi:MAG: hypothetical protein GX594_01000 [Pirellulaceae bacterium]|nr:hypothetical protein [Pirellulaceae bacterium]